MSLLEIVGSILTELEKVHQKLDRLLASRVEKDWSLLEEASDKPTVMGHPITYTNEEMEELLKRGEKFTRSSELLNKLDDKGVEMETVLQAETEKKEFDDTPIVWVKHNGMKFKACKYKCGHYVGWDNTAKKYLHYDAGFKLIGHDCPKYATPEVKK